MAAKMEGILVLRTVQRLFGFCGIRFARSPILDGGKNLVLSRMFGSAFQQKGPTFGRQSTNGTVWSMVGCCPIRYGQQSS